MDFDPETLKISMVTMDFDLPPRGMYVAGQDPPGVPHVSRPPGGTRVPRPPGGVSFHVD